MRLAAAALAAIVAVSIGACSITPGSGTGMGCQGAAATAACTHAPSAPPGTAARDAAIARARTVVGDAAGTARVVWAEVSDSWVRGQVAEAHPWTWGVRLEDGDLSQPSCEPGQDQSPPPLDASPCLDRDGGIVVLLDAFSLEVLGTGH